MSRCKPDERRYNIHTRLELEMIRGIGKLKTSLFGLLNGLVSRW